jgi:hypothetical protein
MSCISLVGLDFALYFAEFSSSAGLFICGLEDSLFKPREIRNWSKDDVLLLTAYQRSKMRRYLPSGLLTCDKKSFRAPPDPPCDDKGTVPFHPCISVTTDRYLP